jgi:acyl-CoA synthetase (AMP-forming)/AMP-acid ligase II
VNVATTLLPNGWHYAVCYFGVQLAGAVAVLVNTRLTGTEIEHVLRDSGARLVLTHDILGGRLAPGSAARPVRVATGATGRPPRPRSPAAGCTPVMSAPSTPMATCRCSTGPRT